MKILIVGANPETEIIARKLLSARQQVQVYCWPRLTSPDFNECEFPIDDTATVTEVARAADRHKVDLVILSSPEAVQSGLANVLEIYRVPCFGPTRVAAHFQWDSEFLARYAGDCGINLIDRQVSYQLEDAENRAKAKLAKEGTLVVSVSCASGQSLRFHCHDEGSLMHAFSCIRQVEGRDRPISFHVESDVQGARTTYVAFVQGKKSLPLGFVAKSQDFLPGAGEAWAPQEAFAPVTWLPHKMSEKVDREITTPFLKRLIDGGTAYSGLVTFDLIIGRQRIHLCAARSTPDALTLGTLAAADPRDWLEIVKFLTGLSAVVDASHLSAQQPQPTVGIVPPFDINVPPTIGQGPTLREARATAVANFSQMFPVGQGVEGRTIESLTFALARES